MTQHAFSLIELLAAVTIAAILAACAYPNYRSYLLKGQRQHAQIQLHTAAQQLEQYYHQHHHYTGANINISNDNYTIATTILTDNDYTLTATPTNSQSKDDCGTMTLNYLGQQTAQKPNCWP